MSYATVVWGSSSVNGKNLYFYYYGNTYCEFYCSFVIYTPIVFGELNKNT